MKLSRFNRHQIRNFKNDHEYSKTALEIRQMLFTGDHPLIAESLKNMAVSYTKLGDDEIAAVYYKKAFE